MANEAMNGGTFVGTPHDHMLIALIEASAERAADRAAQVTVTETFRLLGVDLGNETEVRATRESMSLMRDRWHAKRETASSWRRGAIQTVFTILLSLASTLIGLKFWQG